LRAEKKEKNSVVNLSYPHAPTRKYHEKQFTKFLEMIKKLQINLPFSKALEQMPIMPNS